MLFTLNPEKLSLFLCPSKIKKSDFYGMKGYKAVHCTLTLTSWQIDGCLYCWLMRFHTVVQISAFFLVFNFFLLRFSHCSKSPILLCFVFICGRVLYLGLYIFILKLQTHRYRVTEKAHHWSWPKSERIIIRLVTVSRKESETWFTQSVIWIINKMSSYCSMIERHFL